MDAPEISPRGLLHLGAALDGGTRLLVIRDPATGAIAMNGAVVAERLALHLVAGVAVHDRLELGVALSTAAQGGEGTLSRPAIETVALGDLRLRGKLALVRRAVRLAAAVELSLPTSTDDALFGDRTTTVTAALLAGVRLGRLELLARAGYRMRGPTRLEDLVVDDELVGALAARYPVVASRLWLHGELYGAVGVQGRGGERSRPAEVLGGLRFRLRGPWYAQAGIAAGVTEGYGTAELRGVAMVGFAPSAPPAPRAPVAFVPPEDADEPVPAAPPASVAEQIAPPEDRTLQVIGDRIVFASSVLFDRDGSELKPEASEVLDAVVALWAAHPEWEAMAIEGHTDTRGEWAHNLALSERRAARVREALLQRGIAPDRVTAVGLGEARPRAAGTSEADHAQNRRVEFVITRRRVE
ncbi:MAG: OmpA family protein [Kofleriaceae bacterium]